MSATTVIVDYPVPVDLTFEQMRALRELSASQREGLDRELAEAMLQYLTVVAAAGGDEKAVVDGV